MQEQINSHLKSFLFIIYEFWQPPHQIFSISSSYCKCLTYLRRILFVSQNQLKYYFLPPPPSKDLPFGLMWLTGLLKKKTDNHISPKGNSLEGGGGKKPCPQCTRIRVQDCSNVLKSSDR